jgi:hypothetical protein
MNDIVKPSLHVVPPPDPFDPANLRLDQSFMEHGESQKLLTTVPVRKPNKQDYVRVHPAEEYRMTAALIMLNDDNEAYVVVPTLQGELIGEWQPFTLYTYVNRQKVVAMWPVRLPGPDGKNIEWWRSAHEAAERAMEKWLRITSNKNLGAYEMHPAKNQSGEPEWPDVTFKELLKIGFRDRLVDSHDHPVLKRLRGEM